MRVFVTGATGFIGSAVVKELIGAGHRVLGLTRSDEGARALVVAGADVHRGELTDLESLRAGAAASDGVIHTAFIHDFSNFQENCTIDRRAIEALGSALAGTDKPFIVSAGIPPPAPGTLTTEDDEAPAHPAMPRVSEQTALATASQGVRVSVMRLPQVHDPVKQGLVSYLIALAREKGVSPYVGTGQNRWAAVHRSDAATLYRLVLENGESGAKYHAVAEEGIPVRDIAEAVGRGLRVPVVSMTPDEAPSHFGPLAFFAGLDLAASSMLTQRRIGWRPTGPDLLADLEQMRYVEA